MKDEKQAIELDIPVPEEVAGKAPNFVPIVNTTTARTLLPALIKIAAVELARRDHDACR